ncbi:MAG: hypothetical protein K2H13_07595 [Eubacterium sp.]|nr:hypothetical protein [Eubacterium sp.]
MKQSDRIRYCREYHNHPLRKEYELKKTQILEQNNICDKLFGVTLVLRFVYLGVFVIGVILGLCGMSGVIVIITYGAVGLGIINLIVSWILLGLESLLKKSNEKKYKKELQQLENEYFQKGLYEITESQLFNHECCEYDDYREMYVCCATKQPLSYRDISFCKQPGNCKYCKAFVTAYLGPDGPKYWSYEFKR